MFNKLKTYKKFDKEIITIQQLQSIVKNNPQKEYIEYVRGLEYKSPEYNKSKENLSCIIPHGLFSSLSNDTFIKFTNYLYFDIDGINTKQELNDTIKRLCDTFPISFLQRSVSNRGFHFLIKLDDTFLIPNDTFFFIEVYSYVRQLLLDKDFDIDMSASGLSRKMILSSDKDCILNNEVSLSIDKVSFNIFRDSRNSKGKVKLNPKQLKKESIELNDTFFELIPIKELLQQIKIETKYTKEINGDFIIEDMEYYYISLPEIIMDGTKHTLYTRVVNALYFINNNISRSQILSYIYYINNRANPGMPSKYLYNFITRLCDKIEENGVKIKPRIKRIHFNKESNLTKKQKQSMAAQINGTLRTNKTRETIQNAKYELGIRNMKITQKEVAKYTGLGIATVKRNWTLEKKEISVQIPDIIEKENNKILEEIDENLFFKNEVEIIDFKGFKKVEIDKVSTDDKKLFISKINALKENNIEPSEEILYDLNLWNKEKTWYLYTKWRKNNPYSNYEIKD